MVAQSLVRCWSGQFSALGSVGGVIRAAVLAEAVEHGAHGIEAEAVGVEEVGADGRKLITVKVDERAAAFAFAVEAGVRTFAGAGAHVLEAGGAVHVDDVFVDQAFRHEVFQLAVDGGLPDGHALGAAVGADVRCGGVDAGRAGEAFEQDVALLGLVFGACIHNKILCVV